MACDKPSYDFLITASGKVDCLWAPIGESIGLDYDNKNSQAQAIK